MREAITELEEIHYELCNHYFFKERLEEIDNLMKGKQRAHTGIQSSLTMNPMNEAMFAKSKFKLDRNMVSIDEEAEEVRTSTLTKSAMEAEISELRQTE